MIVLRTDEGFTLVEVMTVVLIIGILVAIAVPVFEAAKSAAQQRTCFANERTIDGAYENYRASGGAVATDLNSLIADLTDVGNPYLAHWPKCPAGGTYSALYAVGNESVTLTCTLHNHF